MKDGFLILVKSVPGGGEGIKTVGKKSETKKEVMKIRVLQTLDSDPCESLPTQHIL